MARHTVYRIYNDAGRLLYVGASAKGAQRWDEHSTEQPWWREVSFIKVEHFPTRDDALQAEANAIRNENPLYNLIRYDGRFTGARIYREHRTGSVFQRRRDGAWSASIRWYGDRFTFYAGKDKAAAEAWLALFLANPDAAVRATRKSA